MLASSKKSLLATFAIIFFNLSLVLYAQSGGNSTSVVGTVTDPTGAVVADAIVNLRNPVSGFERNTATDSSGKFSIPNVPFNLMLIT